MLTETLTTTDTTVANDDNVYCDDCNVALTDAEIDECGFQCTTCYAKSHFTCVDCGDSYANDEASPKCKTRCETCQESKDEEELTAKMDALKEEGQDLLDSIFNDADPARLKKAVASLKRLQPA